MKLQFKFLIPTTLLFGLVLSCSSPSKAEQGGQAAKKRPNIIFILSDDHAYQAIGAYGSKIAKTPNIDRIAKEGALFHNMFVTNSICGPSRATLLTGKFSHMNGFKNNGKDKFDPTQQSVAKVLQSGGYQTAWIGKWHLGTLPVGFDYWKIPPGQGDYYNPIFIDPSKDTVRYEGYMTELITQFSLDWLNDRNQEKPFMLVIGEKATHRTWVPDLQDLGKFDNVEFPLPETFFDDYKGREAAKDQDMSIKKTMNMAHDLKVHTEYKRNGNYRRFTPEQKKVFQEYYDTKITHEFDSLKLEGAELAKWKYQRYIRDYLSTAESLDRNVGKILDYLDESGLAENTVVIYSSDQGFYLGEHGWFDKRFMYEESFKTPFLMRYLGVTKPGTVVSKLAMNIDWAPTMLDIAGLSIPAEMQGKSFLPLVDSKAKVIPWRKSVFYHYYEFPQPHHVSPHFGIRTERYKLIRFYGPADNWEFFDLLEDPQELENNYNSKKYKKVISNLKKQLVTQARSYQDEEAVRIAQTAF